jgi:ADP-ribose pyrophosphatase YjhB (NUDIX family)
MNETNLACWYRVGVKAVVIKDDSVLLVKEGSDLWDFPGGGLEHEETIHSGLLREASEELNAELASHNKKPIYVGKSYDPINERPVIVLYFTARLASDNFHFGDSVTDISYRKISDLNTDMFEPYMQPYIHELLDILKQEVVSGGYAQI